MSCVQVPQKSLNTFIKKISPILSLYKGYSFPLGSPNKFRKTAKVKTSNSPPKPRKISYSAPPHSSHISAGAACTPTCSTRLTCLSLPSLPTRLTRPTRLTCPTCPTCPTRPTFRSLPSPPILPNPPSPPSPFINNFILFHLLITNYLLVLQKYLKHHTKNEYCYR